MFYFVFYFIKLKNNATRCITTLPLPTVGKAEINKSSTYYGNFQLFYK